MSVIKDAEFLIRTVKILHPELLKEYNVFDIPKDPDIEYLKRLDIVRNKLMIKQQYEACASIRDLERFWIDNGKILKAKLKFLTDEQN